MMKHHLRLALSLLGAVAIVFLWVREFSSLFEFPGSTLIIPGKTISFEIQFIAIAALVVLFSHFLILVVSRRDGKLKFLPSSGLFNNFLFYNLLLEQAVLFHLVFVSIPSFPRRMVRFPVPTDVSDFLSAGYQGIIPHDTFIALSLIGTGAKIFIIFFAFLILFLSILIAANPERKSLSKFLAISNFGLFLAIAYLTNSINVTVVT